MYIVQFQSRVVVFIKWAIQDLTFNRGSRLITGEAASDFNFDQEIARGMAAPLSELRAPASAIPAVASGRHGGEGRHDP